MRIGCLQFAPQVGDVDNNLNRADAVLNRVDAADMENLDLLVLPEMAFSGYNFKSRDQILPFLEPPGSGISSLWARTTALKFDCIVAVGYPERAKKEPSGEDHYNSLIVLNGDGETVANYRKSFLYYTDETWAKEGGGFYQGEIQDLGKVAMGICMDLNPYKFETPWSAFEFGSHILKVRANLVIISMAWLTREDASTFTQLPNEPDMETLTYWVQRLEPIIRAEGEDEIIVVFANRCGVEGEVVYAGTSAVLGVQNGEVSVYGLLGRGAKELLVVDTETPPFAKLVNRPEGPRDADEELSVSDGTSDSAYGTAQGGARSSSKKPPSRSATPAQQNHSTTTRHDRDHGHNKDAEYLNMPHYSETRDVHGPRQAVSPSHSRASNKATSAHGGSEKQYHHPVEETRSSRGNASPRDAHPPKASPGFRRAASGPDGYSPSFPSPREEQAARPASRRNQYSPGLTYSRAGYSPKPAPKARMDTPIEPPSRRNLKYVWREPSPEEWYNGAFTTSQTTSSGRVVDAPITVRDQDGADVLRDLASPSFPEPTPLSVRPKLAISTGPETLPPMPKRDPPRGVQPGNFFSSRDLCTPPETPFDDEPQTVIQQQYWVPPSAFTHTPEEPEWPPADAIKGAEGVGQLAASAGGRRPSAGNIYAPQRAAVPVAPNRPASRTQEVKLSDLNDGRYEQDVPSRQASKSRNSSRARGPVPDRRPTPGPATDQRLRSKRSQSSIKPPIPPPPPPPPDRHLQLPPHLLPGPIQTLRDSSPSSSSPWNSITIAASPSVFKTEFHRSETFPRSSSSNHNNTTTSKPRTSTDRDRDRDRDRLKRSKSIPTLYHHYDDPANYLPSPALPVHKAYQDMIYSAVEPGVSIDQMWTAAAAAAEGRREGQGSLAGSASRSGSVSGSSRSERRGGDRSRSTRRARVRLDRVMMPDILSPMTV